MNEANEIAKIITDNIRQATVCIRDAERAAVEMVEPHKERIINQLIEAEMKLAKTLNGVVTGEIEEPICRTERMVIDHDRK